MRIIIPDDKTDFPKVKLLAVVQSSLELKIPESQNLGNFSNFPLNNTRNDKR